jgi:hypothetical protein
MQRLFKVTKREFIYDNKLYFKEGLLSEDVEWFMRCILKLNTIQLAPISCYAYRFQRAGSITSSVNVKNLQHLLATIESFYLTEVLKEVDAEKKEIHLSFLAYQLSIVIGYYSRIKKVNATLLVVG